MFGFSIPMLMDYTVSFGNVAGYVTPEPIQRTATRNGSELLVVNYEEVEYVDLSMVNVNGTALSARETANCYVIHSTGHYELPLVYGCGIKKGVVNAASYTQITGTNTQPFFNYLNNQITSPFIETDTGVEAVAAEVVLCDNTSYTIAGCYLTSRGLCKYLRFEVSSFPALGGNATIAIKDSTGTIMWS